MKTTLTLAIILFSLTISAQDSILDKINEQLVDLHEVDYRNENFEGYEEIKKSIGNAQIVMLGEQSHRDAMTFETKIKLIKYLHEEMDFEILAFESGIYGCDRAWSMMQEGHDVRDAIAKGIFDMWSTLEDLNPLYEYFDQQLNTDNPLMLAGFDPQLMSKLSSDYFDTDLNAYLKTVANVPNYQKEIKQLQAFIYAKRNFKKFSKKKANENIAFIKKLIEEIENQKATERSNFWIHTLQSLKVWMSDVAFDTDDRDLQMANNLIYLQEKFPDKKIICWGATSHFLYNSEQIRMEDPRFQKAADEYYKVHCMMGDYIKKEYKDKVFIIGFIAHEGSYGYNRTIPLESPKQNSLEYLIGKSINDNYFLPLKNITLEGYLSRPLGHQNMTNDISQVMDAVIFNRYTRRPYTDWYFLKYLCPENKVRQQKIEKLQHQVELRKQSDAIKKNERIQKKEKMKARA